MLQEKKKIAVIGASGLTGIDATHTITELLGADVITLDRALPTDPVERAKKEQERQAKVEQYNKLAGLDSLDKKQANWLLAELETKYAVKKLPAEQQGQISSANGMRELLEQNLDGIAMTIGIPRKSAAEERMALAKRNAPIFTETAEQMAVAIRDILKDGKAFKLPTIINIGNPADTSTEIFARELHDNLMEMASDPKNHQIKEALLDIAQVQIPQKIIGFGGVVDSARAKLDFAEKLGISDELAHNIHLDVWGPHSNLMISNIEDATITIDGRDVSLLVYASRLNPNLDIKAAVEEAREASRKGGGAVLDNYKSLGIDEQSNVFAAGAGLATMFHHVLNDTKEQLTASVCNPEFFANDNKKSWGEKVGALGAGKETETEMGTAMTGRLVRLGADGVSDIQTPPPHVDRKLVISEALAAMDYAKIINHLRQQNILASIDKQEKDDGKYSLTHRQWLERAKQLDSMDRMSGVATR